MKSIRNLFFAITFLALLLAPGNFLAQEATAADPVVYTCLPTCEENDARFLSVAGQGLNTMADEAIYLEFAAPSNAAALEIGIFDGDTSGYWDRLEVPMQFTLYADPLAQGDDSVQVEQWMGTSMPDNDWFTVSISTTANAQSPSGYYFYYMVVNPTQVNPSYWSNFKVRTDGVVSLAPQAFAFTTALLTEADGYVIYPKGPNDLTQTTYDGRFDFHAYSMNSMDHFAAWDADLDFGSYDLIDLDTDDPDTPDDILPGWAGPSAVFEGVAVGANDSTGAPNDDHQSEIYRRSPSVVYDLAPLDQIDYTNSNPSGNLEWEQFRLDMKNANHPDVHVKDRLPAGLYHVHLRGMDLTNLNAWRFGYNTIGVCAYDPETQESNPCKDLPHPYLIGDTVFDDANADGVQNNGESGISGVEICLYDGHGFPILDVLNNPICKTTDENGEYSFDVEPYTVDPYTGEVVEEGVYTVKVMPGNFVSGGPLYGQASTTGGQEQTNTVIDANVLTYDFGYTICPHPHAPGTGTIGYWKNHPHDWPVERITVGGRKYTKGEAIWWMNKPSRGDKTIDLFKQLVAAKLNVLIGNESSCIEADIQAADAWLAQHPLGSRVSANSWAWRAIADTFSRLDKYNNGKLCAPHRD